MEVIADTPEDLPREAEPGTPLLGCLVMLAAWAVIIAVGCCVVALYRFFAR